MDWQANPAHHRQPRTPFHHCNPKTCVAGCVLFLYILRQSSGRLATLSEWVVRHHRQPEVGSHTGYQMVPCSLPAPGLASPLSRTLGDSRFATCAGRQGYLCRPVLERELWSMRSGDCLSTKRRREEGGGRRKLAERGGPCIGAWWWRRTWRNVMRRPYMIVMISKTLCHAQYLCTYRPRQTDR